MDLADELESVEVVVLAIKAQLDFSIRALPQRLYHHVLVHKRTALHRSKQPFYASLSKESTETQLTIPQQTHPPPDSAWQMSGLTL